MSNDQLLAASHAIKSHYHSATVLLFGSFAKGIERPDSDIDLCILVDNPNERPLEISRKLRTALHPILKKPLDLLVYDRKKFQERAALSVTMESEIAEEAREL